MAREGPPGCDPVGAGSPHSCRPSPSCSARPPARVRSDSDELLIYNAQHESLTKEWIDAFTKETGIKVTYRQGGDTELGNQLVAEGDASPADVFLTENSPAMAAVEKAGLFADLDAETLDQVPAQYRPATGKWTGVAARSTVFVYNKTKLATRSAAEIHGGPASSPHGRAAGVAPRPRRTSKPSSRPCSSSRVSRPPRSGWQA